ncbi:MAG: hypothetical protein V1718_04115 [archaeon]
MLSGEIDILLVMETTIDDSDRDEIENMLHTYGISAVIVPNMAKPRCQI